MSPSCDCPPLMRHEGRNMSLSEREKQILEQVVLGRQTKEIARELGLSPRTVEIHRSHILHKLGARNSVELVRKALIRDQEGAAS